MKSEIFKDLLASDSYIEIKFWANIWCLCLIIRYLGYFHHHLELLNVFNGLKLASFSCVFR